MKLKKFLKLFSFAAFLFVSCCFSAFAVKETYTIGGKQIAEYELFDHPTFGFVINVYSNVQDPTQEDKEMIEFAKHMREKFKSEGKRLKGVGTTGLTYFINGDNDLTISPRIHCTDFAIKKWALILMDCTFDPQITSTYTKRDPYTEVTRTKSGTYEVRERVRTETWRNFVYWGNRLRDVIIKDPRVKPRTLYPTGTASEAEGWWNHFKKDGQCCHCRNIIFGTNPPVPCSRLSPRVNFQTV